MRKRICVLILILGVFVGNLTALEGIADFKDNFTEFSKDVAQAMPMNSLIGSDWSDAYIGQLLAIPPHFGVGITLGATALPTSAMEAVFSSYGKDFPEIFAELPAIGGFPFPAGVLNARVGGLFVPFDVGVKIGMTPSTFDLGNGSSFNYLLIGADFRYALLKGNILLPRISVGIGVNHLSGEVVTSSFGSYELDSFGGYDLSIDDTKMTFAWETTTVDIKAQISKTFIFVTPYAGVGLTTDILTRAGGGFSGSPSVAGGSINDFQEALDAAGYEIEVDDNNFVLFEEQRGRFIPRFYLGTSITFLLTRLDVNMLYNLSDQTAGFNVNLRFQI